MCHTGGEMYEGKNIHYSPVDNKPLCSFSSKKCKQRRLNGYGFCVRHILEDPTAPFRRCAYVAKSSQQMCTQAIPHGQQRQYCNNHMQVLGMLPRRERKPKKEKDKEKEKDREMHPSPDASKLTFEDRLKTRNLTTPKIPMVGSVGAAVDSIEDPDDPYAFHDATPEVRMQSGIVNSGGQLNSSSIATTGLLDSNLSRLPSTQPISTPTLVRSPTETNSGLPKAKLYPELAEKLEKVRVAPESKMSKSRARSSRTMNKLQTKIAQNKIKDKLRKSQESNQADFSPSQVASPESGQVTPTGIGSNLADIDVTSLVGLPNFSPAQLQSLHLPGLGFSHLDSGSGGTLSIGSRSDTEVSRNVLGLDSLPQAAMDPQLVGSLHALPPPYPGLPSLRDSIFGSPARSSGDPSHISGILPSASSSLHISSSSSSHSASQATSELSSSPVSGSNSHRHEHLQHHHVSHQQILDQPSSHVQRPLSIPLSLTADSVLDLPSLCMASLPVTRSSGFSQTSSMFSVSSTSVASQKGPLPPISSVNVLGTGLNTLPPPPPYVSTTVTETMPRNVSLSKTSSVLHTRPRRLKGLLSEKEARTRLNNDLAVKVYGIHVHERINNHVLLGSNMGVCSSDEEDSLDGRDDETLPWQSDWRVISDDEEDNEQDVDGELPSVLRMAKLGLLRARMRRQCTQTKHATRGNTRTTRSSRKFTLSLLRLAKENPSKASQTLGYILKKPLHWPGENPKKYSNPWRKVCLYKDDTEKQCINLCLPYTNHCRKHIMYNVDQQLFQFCTAKFADNTQCCVPVVDLRYDFPLCFVHAAKLEKTRQEEAAEVKKRPRKKTKPPALTRPPRKGKKKKGRYVRPQKPMPPDKPTGDINMPETIPMEIIPETHPTSVAASEAILSIISSSATHVSPTATVPLSQTEVETHLEVGGVRTVKGAKHLEHGLGSVDLEETLSPDFDKQFELPLQQASRLLEEQDFQEVFNKIPDEAFSDIFSLADRNGDHEPSAQETEELERALAEATKDVKTVRDTLDKLLKGTINMEDLGEEVTQQVAEVLAQNFTVAGISDAVQQLQQHDAAHTAATHLDIYNGLTRGTGMVTLPSHPSLQQQSTAALQQHYPQDVSSTNSIPTFAAGVTVAGSSRVVSQNVSTYVPATVSTSVNGVTLSTGLLSQDSTAVYGLRPSVLTTLPSGYLGTSAMVTQGYTENQATSSFQNVNLASTLSSGQSSLANQGQSLTGQVLHPLSNFSPALQGLPSAAVLLSSNGDILASQPTLLNRNLASSQHQQIRGSNLTTSATAGVTSVSQALNRTLRVDVNASGLHQQQSSPVTVNQLQTQPILAAQLTMGTTHPAWLQTSVTQHQPSSGVSYHLNGFPSATHLPFAHSAPPTSASAPTALSPLPKFSTLVAGSNSGAGSPQSGLITNATHIAASVPKHDHRLLAVNVSGVVNPSGMAQALTPGLLTVMGTKQDPRFIALAQTMNAARSLSPADPAFGTPAHSPSPTPQTGLPPVSSLTSVLPAFQTSSTGS